MMWLKVHWLGWLTCRQHRINPAFVSVGDKVTKGQTLLIIEAMKVMNEVPAPKDGVVTEILVTNEEMVEFGKGLVRIK